MKKQLSLLACLFFVAMQSPAQPTPQRGVSAGAFPRYELEIKLDPDQHWLEGRGTLWIPATDQPRDFIRLGLGENMRDLVVEVMEPKECAGAIALDPGFPIGGANGWVVRPAKPFPAGRPARLRFAWQGGEKSSFVFYLGPEGSFASGINTAWYPMLENGLGAGTLRITVPAGLIVHANGLQRGSQQERAQGVFHYESVTPSFFTFVAGKYTVTRREGAIPVSVYLLKPRAGVDEYVEGCRKSIEVLSNEFGPYPSGEFAIVETPEAQARAAGFTGASVTGFILVTGEFLDQRFNFAYYGHEIAHQWWGNLIRRAGTRGNWMLNEAMAQYGSLRVVETLEGAAAAERYRRTGYPGYIEDQSGLGYLKVLAAGRDFPLSNIPDNASRTLADGKGFQVLDLLSRTVGRDNFRRILREFTERHAFQRVTWDEFLQAIERGAGRNLQWFYDQWFERTGAPEWQLSWLQEGETVRGEITQAQPYYRATLEVRAESREGQKQSLTVEVEGAKTEFTLPVKFAAQTVVLDPHFQVLRWTPEFRAAVAQASAQPPSAAEQELFNKVDDYIRAEMRRRNIPGLSLAILREGKVIKQQGYGLASIELKVPATSETVYQLASIAKTFTGTAIMSMVEEGRLSLDDRVNRLLPTLPAAWSAVTVRHCLTHTSGLPPDVMLDPKRRTLPTDTRDEALKRLSTLPVAGKPGENFAYNQTGYMLLGMIIEKLSGVTFEEFMAKRFFRPLGMISTGYGDAGKIIPGRASLYSRLVFGENTPNISEELTALQWFYPTYQYASAGLNSTVGDLAKWDAALSAGRILRQSTLDEMWTPMQRSDGTAINMSGNMPGTQPGPFYSYGWIIHDRPGHKSVGHSGGAASAYSRFLSDKLTVIVLTNCHGAFPESIVEGVAAIYIPALTQGVR